MNLKELKELIEMLQDTDVSELEIERSGVKVRIRKGGDVTYHPAMPRMEYPPHTIVAPAVVETSSAQMEQREAEPVKTNQIKVTAPIVGSFYRSSSPDKPAYVEVGDVVKKGQVLCIIEAMKLMNEIESEAAGKIVQVVVENGSPVEYGQPLFVIEPM
jgi:acetyl-CoA carboxylase biotin carboxyl carrier protein